MNEERKAGSGGNAYSGSGYGGSSGYGSGGYGGPGYGGYYYGYGYNYGGGDHYGDNDNQPQRGIKDYLLILKERIWYFFVTFFIFFVGVVLYTFQETKIYRAQSSVQVLRDDADVLGTGDLDYDTISNTEDFMTQVKILESYEMVRNVAERIKDQDRVDLMAPYQDAFRLRGKWSVEEVLMKNRSIVPIRLSLMIAVYFEHPQPDMAKKVANLFADEFVNYNMRLNIDSSMRAVEDLRRKVDSQKAKVEEIQDKLVAYREKHRSVSLDRRDNILSEQLNALNNILTEDKRVLDVAETSWKLIKQFQEEGKPLWDLPFIASDARINDLLRQRSAQKIEIASLEKRYRAKHPRMIQAQKSLQQIEDELNAAIDSSVVQLDVQYVQAKENYELSTKRLAEKEREVLDLNKLAVEYDSLQRDFDVESGLYQQMVLRMTSEKAKISLQGESARIIDRAVEPAKEDFYKPNYPMNVAIALFGGVGLGLGLVFVIAFLDDRIKSAFDIESTVGIPLIGVVPRIKRLNSPDKARSVASNSDRRVTEAFRAIHSAMKINEVSKNAKVIITTSTSPSEGKSFVTTNMALTFAIHGERTLVMDADLRMPNIGKSLSIDESHKGMNQHFNDNVPLDDVIIKDFYPNLDVLTAGGKCKNPTQILNSPHFEQLLAKLAERYDRIFIDSPPIAAVSDVLSISPHADGIVYVVKYNAVKRKTAKANLRRLMDSNTPIFGAVLNQITIAVASHYYTNYYDKSYQDYYRHDELEDRPLQKEQTQV